MKIYYNKIVNTFRKLEIYKKVGIIIKLDRKRKINNLI